MLNEALKKVAAGGSLTEQESADMVNAIAVGENNIAAAGLLTTVHRMNTVTAARMLMNAYPVRGEFLNISTKEVMKRMIKTGGMVTPARAQALPFLPASLYPMFRAELTPIAPGME